MRYYALHIYIVFLFLVIYKILNFLAIIVCFLQLNQPATVSFYEVLLARALCDKRRE